MQNVQLSVSCDHAFPAYRREAEKVEARYDKGYPEGGQPGGWYVSMSGFGCSKTYKSPEAAVRGMLESHACRDIKVERVNPTFTVNHLEDHFLNGLRQIARKLTEASKAISMDEQRDLGQAITARLDSVETAEAVAPSFMKSIQDALGTGEVGEGLVEVARNACAAERAKAGEQYNGWPNYETWITYTWVTNEEGTYKTVRSLARIKETEYAAAEYLKEVVPELLAFPVTGLAADFCNAALSRVDWMRIAESLRSE